MRKIPDTNKTKIRWDVLGWKGETVQTQVLLYGNREYRKVKILFSDLESENGNRILSTNVQGFFVRYVVTNGLAADGGGCNIPTNLDSSLAEDILDTVSEIEVDHYSVQPVWISVHIPGGARPGKYSGRIFLTDEQRSDKSELEYTVTVVDRSLPASASWQFHLDLWQNPYAIARVSQTKEWSPEHFQAMTPYMKMLAGAGQKTITTTLIYDPWNSQTYDRYGSMVKWTKRTDGSWIYDYEKFDGWVSYMMLLGIGKQINCYSMIPWNNLFHYYNESTGKDSFLIAKPGSKEYNDHWRPMLTDFKKHLKVKGWFSITTIAMDERPLTDMLKAIALIRQVDSSFKISLAGNYHAEIETEIFDYCVASNQIVPEDVVSRRKKQGMVTTFYTSCTEGKPNVFTFSQPGEASWLAWHTLNDHFDGYLRWAYNCWNANPLEDSRFGKWSAGDAFLVYPGPRSSIRFEMLKKGIQDFEKFQILQQEFVTQKQFEKLEVLTNIPKPFFLDNLNVKNPKELISDAEALLNSLQK